MDDAQKARINRYFAGFHGKMGHVQVVSHLCSLPRWWKLRDRQGRTPIMRAVEASGLTSKVLLRVMMDHYDSHATLADTDHGGKNLWWHLLRHQSYRNDERTKGWVGLLRERVKLQPSTTSGRGIFVDQILAGKTKQWSGFFPSNDFARQLYGLSGNTYATWWHCEEDDAPVVACWLLAVRDFQYRDINRSIGSNLERCHRNDPEGLARLPMALRGSLMMLNALHGDRELARAEQERGVWVFTGTRARTRLTKEIQSRPGVFQAGFAELLLDNDKATLAQTTPKAQGGPRVRRL